MKSWGTLSRGCFQKPRAIVFSGVLLKSYIALNERFASTPVHGIPPLVCKQRLGTVRQNELELCREALYPLRMTKYSPFRYFKTSPEIIRLAVMLYVRFPLSLRNVEDPLHERGIEISHETVRFWWNRFRPLSAKVRCRPLFSPQPFQSRADGSEL